MKQIVPTITIVKSRYVVTNATHSTNSPTTGYIVDADTMREAVLAARRKGLVGPVTVKPAS